MFVAQSSRRRWQRRRFCHHWKFDVQTEAYGYAKFAYTDPLDAEAITGSRFASLWDAPFYSGSVNTGNVDTTNSILIDYNNTTVN